MDLTQQHPRPRTALVAGGTGALGTAVVDALLADGERVCVPWRSESGAEALRQRHAAALEADRLRLSQCDVAKPDQLAALLDVLGADWGKLWLACSTAGAWAGGDVLEAVDDLTLLDQQLLANLQTATVVAREGLRHMGPAGGRIVLVGSRTVDYPARGQAAYSAAKAGLHSLVATLGQELRNTGRTANAVVPKVIDTPSNREAMPDASHERWVPPEAIAGVITWLASAQAWPVSGAAIPVYGDA